MRRLCAVAVAVASLVTVAGTQAATSSGEAFGGSDYRKALTKALAAKLGTATAMRSRTRECEALSRFSYRCHWQATVADSYYWGPATITAVRRRGTCVLVARSVYQLDSIYTKPTTASFTHTQPGLPRHCR